MTFKASYVLVFFLGLSGSKALAGMEDAMRADSLMLALRAAGSDTTRIRLRYCLGIENKIVRPGYWDSLSADAHRRGLSLFEVRALNGAGSAYRRKNNRSKAEERFEKGISMAERLGYKRELIALIYDCSRFYMLTSSAKKSLDMCFRGLKVAEELRDKKKCAEFYSTAGTCYFLLGDFNKALKIQISCLSEFREIGDNTGVVEALLDIGACYCSLRDTANSVKYYLESKTYESKIPASDFRCLMLICHYVAGAYQLMRQHDSAYKYACRAYKIAAQAEEKTGMAAALTSIANALCEKGKLKEARKTAFEAYDLARSIGFYAQTPVLALELSNIEQKAGNYRKAMEYYRWHIRMRDSLSNEQVRKQALEREFAYNLDKKENENKLLEQKTRIQSLELKQNKYFLWGMGAMVMLVVAVAYLFFRQARIRNEQRSTQLEQKLLLSQMNPHFIFNSLQAIQSFILGRDDKQAVKYLSSFANVTRNVLENSRAERIPLKKEMSLLENYLQLQKLRYGNRFDYSIRVEENIDAEVVLIPPMLGQPFIENAVEHGLHGVESGGRIEVFYSLNQQTLVLEISDNGYGIKNGRELSKNHRSLATEITRERIALMNKKSPGKASFAVSEAFPDEAGRKGVKIAFRLPLET